VARPPKPWYHARRGLWGFTRTEDGTRKFIPLAPKGAKARTKAEAERAFHALMAREGRSAVGPHLTVGGLAALFRDRAEAELKPATARFYRERLGPLAERFGPLRATDFKPLHLGQWLAGRPVGPATQRQNAAAAKSMFGWAVRMGVLAVNPLASVRLERMPRRRAVISPEGWAAVRAELARIGDRHFTDFLTVLEETGCRPGEAAGLTARDIDRGAGVARPADDKSRTLRGGGEAKVIHLTPRASEVLARRAADLDAGDRGPLPRNYDGRPWTRNAWRCRFRRMRERLGADVIPVGAGAYSARINFATDAVIAGVDVATVAELLGHAGLKMLAEHYARVADRTEHIKGALGKVRGG
jgi:integrase